MTTTVLAPQTLQKFFDNNGAPLAFGHVQTFAAGTNTPIATYTDSTGGAANVNPITLNARGEASIWLLPNVGYKFALTDAAGNQIPGWPVDNIFQSQLITLYGGVDTGVANNYVINFTASFTTLVDGIDIKWIPANTNALASTINVNGLGPVAITNADGSALVANEIIANQPAEILYKGGKWLLISATATSYSSFTATWVGFSVPPVVTTIPYRLNGPLATIIFPLAAGTSGGASPTAFAITGIPAVLQPVGFQILQMPMVGFIDNSLAVAGGMVTVQAQMGLTPASIKFFKDGTQGAWTGVGNKGMGQNCSITYSVV